MLGFVFPGQGSQQVGMLAGLDETYALVRDVYADAEQVLGYDLWALTQQGPAEQLNQTETTQPAMLAAGYALWRVWEHAEGPRPGLLAGHSLGEYTALVCAGALSFAEALSLVADRGRFMQTAVPAGTGAMAAVLGLSDEQVTSACVETAQGQVVASANFNAPGQTVIAGDKAAVERAVLACKALGSKRAVLLPVSVPSHCDLMKQASAALFDRLAKVSLAQPKIPVIHNVDAAPHQDSEAIKLALVEQVYRPVRWVECMQRFAADGVTKVVECGPGKVLTGLGRRICPSFDCMAMFDVASVHSVISALKI
jgi:[acyl-carrier-protein] S-malonyltransferase